MAAKMSVLGLILSSYPYLRSAMVRFPLRMTYLNPKGHQKHITGSKVKPFLLYGGDFAYRWSCIGKGLRLQAAQQAYFSLNHIL